ncbi:MAG: histidine kinase, partial [Hyphomicrobiales bacterium]|nr:histidine kinase [Hyphomicrobiales bacterium]
LAYLTAGADLRPGDCWERRRDFAFALDRHRAECEFLTGAGSQAEERLAALSARAVDTAERATLACLRMDLYTTLDHAERAIAVGLDYLSDLGIDWPAHATPAQAREEYERIWAQLGQRSIEDLIDLPVMTDPASLATLEVLTRMVAPAMFTDANLTSLVVCTAANLSLERGNHDGSALAYVLLGMVARAHFGDTQAGRRFGQLGYDLVEKRGLKRFEARTYMSLGNAVLVWARHVRAVRDFTQRAFEIATKVGEVTDAAYSRFHLNTNMLAAGDPLVEAQREAAFGLAFAQRARFGLVADVVAAQLALIRTLRGMTTKFGSLDYEDFDERRIEQRFQENPALARAECCYHIRKLQARFLAGDYAAAIEAATKAQALLWTTHFLFEAAEHHFYSALAIAATCEAAGGDERQRRLATLADHHRQLALWAQDCPDNFETRAALVAAEIARVEGRPLDAEPLYEQAIRSARANGFIHNEALAYELAARFYAMRGLEEFAQFYLRKACDNYARWGADAKVRQLNELHPHLTEEETAPGPTSTIGAPLDSLDLATVLKVSQAVSGEIVLERLLDTLMRTAIE